jgi:hypothetical protein
MTKHDIFVDNHRRSLSMAYTHVRKLRITILSRSMRWQATGLIAGRLNDLW